MSERQLKTRIIHKHDVETDWLKSTLIPKQGEIIIYDKDSAHNYERIKIGDGTTVAKNLPFVDAGTLSGASLVTEVADIDNTNDAEVPTSKAVATAIKNASIVYVGPNMPTDPNVKVWINTSEEGTGVVPVLPRIATITLSASAWSGSSIPYSQIVDVNTVTSATKIDLQPTAQQIVSLQNEDIALMAENNGGTVTIYALGGKPKVDYTMQVLLTEVAYV